MDNPIRRMEQRILEGIHLHEVSVIIGAPMNMNWAESICDKYKLRCVYVTTTETFTFTAKPLLPRR